jgi:hypothetical protein
MLMIHIVYKTTNILNNKYYIGVHSTHNINDNYLGCGHWRGRKLRKNSNVPILNAFNKYGDINFKREILFILDTREEALLMEEQLINIDDPMTYNARTGGKSDYIFTESVKKRMSEKAINRSKSNLLQINILKEYSRQRKNKTYVQIYGEEKAKEISLKKSKALTGRKLTEDHKKKMSNNRKGKDCGRCSGRVNVWNSLEGRLMRLYKEDVNTGIENGSIKEQCYIVNKFQRAQFIKTR